MFTASCTPLPRMRSATSRTLRGVARRKRSWALTSTSVLPYRGAGAGAPGAGRLATTFSFLPEWPRKVRVAENSPRVWPTMSGMTVDRRDQVLTTRLVPASLSAATLAARWSSTKKPFLSERAMLYLLLPPPHDHRRGALVATSLVALG